MVNETKYTLTTTAYRYQINLENQVGLLGIINTCLDKSRINECKQVLEKIKVTWQESNKKFCDSAKQNLALLERRNQEMVKSIRARWDNVTGFVSTAYAIHGHSGAPVVNMESGEVVGIHYASDTRSESFYLKRALHVESSCSVR